jgi:hypothetical protein
MSNVYFSFSWVRIKTRLIDGTARATKLRFARFLKEVTPKPNELKWLPNTDSI